MAYLRSHFFFFSLPVLCVAGMRLGWVGAFSVFAVAFVLHPICDRFLADRIAPRGDADTIPELFHRLPVYLCVPVQFAVLLSALLAASSRPEWAPAFGVLAGISGSMIGIASAHELFHSRLGGERALGQLQLLVLGYTHFNLEHRLHHRWVATRRDADTARRGETIYGFWVRSILQGWRGSWISTDRRGWKNPMVGVTLLLAAGYALVFAFFGTSGVVVYAVAGFTTLVMLKWINYVEHYGLERAKNEPVGRKHSWDALSPLTNWPLLNLGFHSKHHQSPGVTYDRLPHANGPWNPLPYGYSAMMMIALVPSVWRRLMDPLLPKAGA